MKTILLVDDSADIRFVLEAILSNAGFKAVACANPEEALKLDLSQFHGVITDNDMPGHMNGVDFIATLRDRGVWVPTVMISGTVDGSIPEKVKALRARFFGKGEAKAAVKSFSEVA